MTGRSLRIASIVIVAGACLAGCSHDAEFRCHESAVRFGSRPLYDRFVKGIRRPLLSIPTAAVTSLAVPSVPAGTLWVSAISTSDAGKDRTCRARFVPAGGESPLQAETTLGARDEWSELRLELPRAYANATLELECDQPSEAGWAQPYVVPGPPAQKTAGQPLVVLLSLDTLRADHVEGFGAPPGMTPVLDALGKEGLRATEAASEFTWTLPSHFVLLHSRFFGFPPSSPGPVKGIARRLSDAGFVTGAFTGGGFVSAAFRMSYGFDFFKTYNSNDLKKSDLETFPESLEDAKAWITARQDAATFVLLHTYAVHDVPPAEKHSIGAGFITVEAVPPEKNITEDRDFYAGLVHSTDEALLPFVRWLKEQSAHRPVLLVVVSDHGEAFAEHRNFRHGASGPLITLHDEITHIPMIFWSPGNVRPGREMQSAIGLIDIAPTLLGAAGVAVPADMLGRDLWKNIAGSWRDEAAFRLPPAIERPTISYKDPSETAGGSWSARTRDFKVIVPSGVRPTPVVTQYYRLPGDPREKHNLAPAYAAGFTAGAEAIWNTLPLFDVPLEPLEPTPVCKQCGWFTQDDYLDAIDPYMDEEARTADKSGTGLEEKTEERLKSLGYAR